MEDYVVALKHSIETIEESGRRRYDFICGKIESIDNEIGFPDKLKIYGKNGSIIVSIDIVSWIKKHNECSLEKIGIDRFFVLFVEEE